MRDPGGGLGHASCEHWVNYDDSQCRLGSPAATESHLLYMRLFLFVSAPKFIPADTVTAQPVSPGRDKLEAT